MSETGYLLTLICVIGALTYVIRASFILIGGRMKPAMAFQRALRFVPVSVLPALVMPALFYRNGELAMALSNERLLAGLLAIAVAVFSRSVLWTLSAGMGTLWLLQYMISGP